MKARTATLLLTGALLLAVPFTSEAGERRGSNQAYRDGRGKRPPATYYRAPGRHGGYYGDHRAYRPSYRPQYRPAYRNYYPPAYRPYYYAPWYPTYWEPGYGYAPGYDYAPAYPYPYYPSRPGFQVGIGFFFRW
jgi:hypothetical protein